MATENFPIDVNSFSYSDIKAKLEEFLASQPDADKWAQFFMSGSGENLKDLVASFAALMRYDTITARREAFIQFSSNRSSKIGASQFLGYSANRGRNAIIEITFTPISTGVYQKYDIIGTVKERDLILLESYAYNSGTPLTVQCAIGEIDEQDLVAVSTAMSMFKFTESKVSEDVRIFIDGNEIGWSNDVTDMLAGKFQLQSNVFGSVDAKYLNLSTFPHRYMSNSQIKLMWINLKDIDWVESDISLDEPEGILTSVSTVSLYSAPESNVSIEVNAPLRNETKMVVRAREDQAKLIKQLDSRILNAKGMDVTSAVMAIYCVIENDLRFTQAERDELIAKFETMRPHGLKPPYILNPSKVTVGLNFTVHQQPGFTGDIVTAVEDTLSAYEYVLGAKINLFDIEQTLESMDFIKVARITPSADAWEALTHYSKGSYISVDSIANKLYIADSMLFFSGETEPTWSVISGETITDGDLIWETVYNDEPSTIEPWQPETNYKIGATVKPSVLTDYVFTIIGYNNKSGTTEPVWPPLAGATPDLHLGSTIDDGRIRWASRPLEGSVPVWEPNKIYEEGSVVKAIDQTGSDTEGVMWEVQAHLGSSSDSLPDFPTNEDETITDNNMIWRCKDPADNEDELANDQYYVFVKNVTVV